MSRPCSSPLGHPEALVRVPGLKGPKARVAVARTPGERGHVVHCSSIQPVKSQRRA